MNIMVPASSVFLVTVWLTILLRFSAKPQSCGVFIISQKNLTVAQYDEFNVTFILNTSCELARNITKLNIFKDSDTTCDLMMTDNRKFKRQINVTDFYCDVSEKVRVTFGDRVENKNDMVWIIRRSEPAADESIFVNVKYPPQIIDFTLTTTDIGTSSDTTIINTDINKNDGEDDGGGDHKDINNNSSSSRNISEAWPAAHDSTVTVSCQWVAGKRWEPVGLTKDGSPINATVRVTQEEEEDAIRTAKERLRVRCEDNGTVISCGPPGAAENRTLYVDCVLEDERGYFLIGVVAGPSVFLVIVVVITIVCVKCKRNKGARNRSAKHAPPGQGRRKYDRRSLPALPMSSSSPSQPSKDVFMIVNDVYQSSECDVTTPHKDSNFPQNCDVILPPKRRLHKAGPTGERDAGLYEEVD